jgi:hypothetical protein
MPGQKEVERLKRVGLTAWRGTILAVATLIVLVMFLGMGYLVYHGQMSDGPLILFAGVILGHLLRSIRDWV